MKLSMDRRQFLKGAALTGAAALLRPALVHAEHHEGGSAAKSVLSADARAALESSPLVYVSPLDASGGESRCHGEVWFMNDGDDVLVVTANDRWKAKAIRAGRETARIWVGDFGPVGSAGDKYRAAPKFDVKATIDTDRLAFEKLMAAFGKKYPDEWAKWAPKFRKGYSNGSRVLIRYSPL